MLLAKSETLILNDDWSLELKFDGIRAVLHVNDETIKIETRNEKDITVSFPEIATNADSMFDEAVILDGEIVGYNDYGIQKLNFVQHRLGVLDPTKIRERQKLYPVMFVVFDVLHAGGRDLYDKPLTARREVLERLIPDETGHKIIMAQSFPVDKMDHLWAFITEQNMEGLVAKRKESKYYPGTRSPQWLKIKHHKMRWK
jgi:bifunctional non-homologous end joining protein LigD